MTKKEFNELPDEKKLEMIYGLLNSVHDFIYKCFAYWGWLPGRITLGERTICEQVLKDCNGDKEILRDSFIEAKAQGKETLAYVRSVAQNLYQKKTLKNNIEKHEEIKKKEKVWNPKEDESWTNILNEIGAVKLATKKGLK